MPVFKWQGKNRQGEVIRGEMEAANAAVAVLNLRKQQIVPIQVKPEKAKSAGFSLRLSRRVTEKEVAVFTRQLAPGNLLVLCCDGLWEMIRNEGLEELLLQGLPPQATCVEGVRRANMAGGEDNISVIVVRLE